jgi:hypothetical protein
MVMKLVSRALVAVAMTLGAVASIGCNRAPGDATPAEESAAAAPVSPIVDTSPVVAASPVVAQGASGESSARVAAGASVNTAPYDVYAPEAPPPPRFEDRGQRPGDRYFWMSGSWSYERGHYVWKRGRWESRRDGYDYAPPRWERANNRWQHRPGMWIARPAPSRPRADAPFHRPSEPHASSRRPHDSEVKRPHKDHDRPVHALPDRKDEPKHKKHG